MSELDLARTVLAWSVSAVVWVGLVTFFTLLGLEWREEYKNKQ